MILLFVLVPPALVIAAAVIWASFIKPAPGRHAFPDPADSTDPDGEAFVASLRDPAGDWWEHHVPRTGRLAMLPPDPDPDPTIIQPADVAYLGKTAGEYVDDLFAKHAPPEVCTQDPGHEKSHAACDGQGHVLARRPRSSVERYWQHGDCEGHEHEVKP